MTDEIYLFGVPGLIGGAATKIRHLIMLLHKTFRFTVVVNGPNWIKEKQVTRFCDSYGVQCCQLKDLPRQLKGVGLVICELDIFASGRAEEIKNRGLKLVFSNEMMWEFKGEAEAVAKGLVDRVLFLSDFQQAVFADLYRNVPQLIVDNYIAPEDFPYVNRSLPTFSIGRLSRPDPVKYPEDFPVFYEELGLAEVRYRVMAWDEALRRKYKWHCFGPEWDLLPPQREPAAKFLNSLDLFVYPLGHSFKESWGRSTAEAMLTGCVPVVPSGHQFHNMMVHGENGFICTTFEEYKEVVQMLYADAPRRRQLGQHCADYARRVLFNEERHREVWMKALTF